ncbi:hypothetical protein [Azospirillum sp. SYSU D00513]|uniref:hypothetical protein n=1 Tax=Azospirillum sp. SYSU D00513 TaxID=2812561 RepID=UPI001A959C50|nr:hypothetical protein [Azospirillum sp. SYSU D00513]
MKIRHALAALAVLSAPTTAFAQQGNQGAGGNESDCAFLERSFQEVYDGLRQIGSHGQGGQGGGQGQGGSMAQMAQQKPELVTMFVGIQQNIILMHGARGCAASDLIAIARAEAGKYGNRR